MIDPRAAWVENLLNIAQTTDDKWTLVPVVAGETPKPPSGFNFAAAIFSARRISPEGLRRATPDPFEADE